VVVLDGGKKEKVTVNLSTTVMEIYAHCKALSDLLVECVLVIL